MSAARYFVFINYKFTDANADVDAEPGILEPNKLRLVKRVVWSLALATILVKQAKFPLTESEKPIVTYDLSWRPL